METQAKKRTSKLAVASLTLAIFGVLTAAAGIGILFFIAALFCGHAGLRAIRKSDGMLQGRDAARVGLGISYGLLIAGAVWVPFLMKDVKSSLAAADAAVARQRQAQSATATPSKPFPPTRTEEAMQRVDAYSERTGDQAIKKWADENIPLGSQLEQRTGEFLTAYSQLDAETIFQPTGASNEKISGAIAGVERLATAASAYKDALQVHRAALTESMTKQLSKETAAKAADNTRENYLKAVAWADAALAFTEPAKRILTDYQSGSKIDPELVKLALKRGTNYEEIQESFVALSERKQAELEKTMPR